MGYIKDIFWCCEWRHEKIYSRCWLILHISPFFLVWNWCSFVSSFWGHSDGSLGANFPFLPWQHSMQLSNCNCKWSVLIVSASDPTLMCSSVLVRIIQQSFLVSCCVLPGYQKWHSLNVSFDLWALWAVLSKAKVYGSKLVSVEWESAPLRWWFSPWWVAAPSEGVSCSWVKVKWNLR